MIRRELPRLLCAAVFAAVFALAIDAEAAKRHKCPVCGQIFDAAVAVCPNDGTDLAREGKTVETPDAAPSEEPAAEGEGGEKAAPKYNRHDLGGERKRTDDGGIDYDDRRSRLGEDRRGEDAAERRLQLQARKARVLAEEDARLRSEFEQRRRRMWEKRRERDEEERRAAEGLEELKRRSLWGRGAPLTSVGLRIAWMREGDDPGPVSSAEIDVNFAKTFVRAGLSSAIGVRSLSHRNDLLFLENVSVGAQLPWRFSPYAVARAGIGALATNRFGADLVYLVRSLGAEAGLDCRLTRWLVVTPSIGYAMYAIDDAYWHSFTARLSVGF